MDMHRDFLELGHRRTEHDEIIVSRVLEIDRNMDVGHAEAADTCRLVRQSLFMAVKPEIDDVANTQGLDVRELLFGRLTGRCHPIIKSTPVVDRFRVSLARLWLRLRSPAGNSADRRGQFSTDIEPAFPERIESLRRGLA